MHTRCKDLLKLFMSIKRKRTNQEGEKKRATEMYTLAAIHMNGCALQKQGKHFHKFT